MARKKSTAQHNTLHLTVDDLIGRQSVRATFKLPQEVIDLLNALASQLSIKKKSLFDQLIENEAILKEVAREARNSKQTESGRRQKTFVISKHSLQSLNFISEQEKISRDLLVEISIRRLLPVIKLELERHMKRKELQKEMALYLQQGKKLLNTSAKLLGKDDKIYSMLEEQIAMAQKNLATVKKLIKNGMAMEDLTPESRK